MSPNDRTETVDGTNNQDITINTKDSDSTEPYIGQKTHTQQGKPLNRAQRRYRMRQIKRYLKKMQKTKK